MPLIHNLILSIQALIARQLRSHFTDKEVEAPGKEAIYQTEHLLTVAEPGKKWAAGTRHPEVLSRPALQGVSQLPGCLTGLPWSLASFSSAGEPGTQTLSCNPPGPPSRRGALKTWGPSPQDCDPKVPHPLLPEARGFFFFFFVYDSWASRKTPSTRKLNPWESECWASAEGGYGLWGQASFAACKLCDLRQVTRPL